MSHPEGEEVYVQKRLHSLLNVATTSRDFVSAELPFSVDFCHNTYTDQWRRLAISAAENVVERL
jgi:hypothetical protein